VLNVEQIEEWLGQEVLDSEGERVGKLEEVYYSPQNGDAVLVSVKSGMLGRRVSVVPLAGASVGRDHIRLAYTQQQMQDVGGKIDTGDTLDQSAVADLGAAYGVELAPEEYESASAINGRRAAARDAEEKAAALEDEARKRRQEADEARGEAQDASSQADQKETDAEHARISAEQARADAQQITPPQP
jgi:sporulation protein YlmC with PRC-barrel domain